MPDRRHRFASGRHAGILIPLFSIPSRESWGIGEIADLPALGKWIQASGFDFVQLLPVNEMQDSQQNSPYSALSAMAIDPIFLSIAQVEEFVEQGGEESLAPDDRDALESVRIAPAVDYAMVRGLKSGALRRAFDAFFTGHWNSRSTRAQALEEFREREGWWLEDYALFRALHEEHAHRYWIEWPQPVRGREPDAISDARERLARPILQFIYLQWLADEQWQRARRACGRVGLFGDFPFMVSGHSADVWSRQGEFRVDASVGVPPDAFSETGQDWGLPVYRWDVIAQTGYQWLRDRTRRCAELYDGFRVDHLVGFYRTFVRERDGRTYFVPDDEAAQRAQGEHLMQLFGACGSRILAEDLGTVPDFVRASMAELRIPGMKVLRWEREWETPGKPFRDPSEYPPVSVAISGTHDTETMAEWWEGADDEERKRIAEVPLMRAMGCGSEARFSEATRDALLKTLLCARSDLAIVPMQDVFGWRDRINTPASVGAQNWSWRLPWRAEELLTRSEAVERAGFLRKAAAKCGRGDYERRT